MCSKEPSRVIPFASRLSLLITRVRTPTETKAESGTSQIVLVKQVPVKQRGFRIQDIGLRVWDTLFSIETGRPPSHPKIGTIEKFWGLVPDSQGQDLTWTGIFDWLM